MSVLSEASPTVSILIINYNTPQLVKSLTSSLLKHVTGISYEIRILNNGCEKKRLITAGELDSEAIHIESSDINLGFAAGSNRLATDARGEYLLFANSDCKVESDIVTKMVEYLEQNPNCAACSPKTLFPDGRTHSSIRQLPTYENIGRSRGAVVKVGRGDYTLDADDQRKSVEAMAATFMAIGAGTFRKMGGFDERFFMYAEDTDLCKRLVDAGYELTYLGDVEVRHSLGASTRQHPLRMKFHHHRSIWRYFRKHYQDRTGANLWLGLKLFVNFCFVALKLPFGGPGS